MCVNGKHFWGEPICNIDSNPPGAELRGKYWPPDTSLVSDQASKQGGVVHSQQCISMVCPTKSLALTKQCGSRIGLKQSHEWQLREAELILFLVSKSRNVFSIKFHICFMESEFRSQKTLQLNFSLQSFTL